MNNPIEHCNPDDPIVRHMRTDPARLLADQTVGEALEAIRANPPANRIIYFYVVDRQGRLCGVVPTRRLLLSPLDQRISQIMIDRVIAIPENATVLDACEMFTLHRLLAFPVVDAQQRLVGMIDIELYTDELTELGGIVGEDLFQIIGVRLAGARPFSPTTALRRRFPWLLCNIAGGIAAALISGIFENELQRAVALALFVPLVLALAESVSIQSLTLALQALHGRPPTWGAMWAKLRRELVTGLLLGAASGSLVGLFALLWMRQAHLVFSVAGGILGGVTAAALLGLSAPNLLRLLKLNPHVAAGPLALALTDIVTLLVYFSLARALIA